GRINVLTALGLALLAAAGVTWVARRARRLARPAAVALVALVLIEGFGPRPITTVPPPPIDMDAAGGPRLHLPQNTQAYVGRYVYWSTDGYTPIVNGDASVFPTEHVELISDVTQFPDAASIERLRAIGA